MFNFSILEKPDLADGTGGKNGVNETEKQKILSSVKPAERCFYFIACLSTSPLDAFAPKICIKKLDVAVCGWEAESLDIFN